MRWMRLEPAQPWVGGGGGEQQCPRQYAPTVVVRRVSRRAVLLFWPFDIVHISRDSRPPQRGLGQWLRAIASLANRGCWMDVSYYERIPSRNCRSIDLPENARHEGLECVLCKSASLCHLRFVRTLAAPLETCAHAQATLQQSVRLDVLSQIAHNSYKCPACHKTRSENPRRACQYEVNQKDRRPQPKSVCHAASLAIYREFRPCSGP